jgi:tRNA dimethylallyltransferase
VQELLAKFPRDSHAFKAIGYRQAADYVEGRVALGQAIADTKTESRRYAKRQLTWFGSDPDIIWLDGQAGSSELEKMAAAQIEIFLGNRAPLN